jgi:hypothetical protein
MSQNVWATIMPFGPVTDFLLGKFRLTSVFMSIQVPEMRAALAGPKKIFCAK